MAETYTTIPGVGTGRGGLQVGLRSRLHAGPDHLLVIGSTGYTEEYRRLFYQDIRYLVVRKTHGQIWQGVISGLFVLLFGILLFFSHRQVEASFFGIIGFPFAIWFLVNLIRGPTCACKVNTVVQTLTLPTPRRLKKVPLLVAFLRGRVAASQPAGTESATV